MRTYLFSIFSRFFLAFSGFAVFLVTAALFGADGRGTIGYGTSLFAITGLILSCNLGRAFLGRTKQDEKLKRELLIGFLFLNVILSLIGAIVGLCYWYLSPVAQQMLSLKQVALFSLTSFFYVWSVNGNALYASFIETIKQEKIILITRSALILFLILLYFGQKTSLDNFISGYSLILFAGSIAEIFYLYRSKRNESAVTWSTIRNIVKETRFHHLDYLSFNIFPLFLTILLAAYAEKSIVGKFNFTLQVINLIFLFAATANIRITTYVSDVGFKARINQYKKLLWATIGVSSISAIIISLGLHFLIGKESFEQFEGVSILFQIVALSIPGYISYQFFNPIWIELHQQKKAAIIHAVNFLVFAVLSPFVLSRFGIMGASWLMVLFHTGLLFAQLHLFRKNIGNLLSSEIS